MLTVVRVFQVWGDWSMGLVAERLAPQHALEALGTRLVEPWIEVVCVWPPVCSPQLLLPQPVPVGNPKSSVPNSGSLYGPHQGKSCPKAGIYLNIRKIHVLCL